MKRLLLAAACLLSALPGRSAGIPGPYAQLINIEGRKTYSLDGWWKFEIDPQMNAFTGYRNQIPAKPGSVWKDEDPTPETVKSYSVNFAAADSIRVPGSWCNARAEWLLYEGAAWYRKRFDAAPQSGKRYFLYFGAAHYEATVALNGDWLGRHEGGYTPFDFEVTGRLRQGRNSIVALVSNRIGLSTVPMVTFDWWNYGGITRSVALVETPETFIRDYYVHLLRDEQPKTFRKGLPERTVCGWVQLDGSRASQEVTVAIPELKASVKVRTDEKGYAEFSFRARPALYSPASPKCYELTLSCETDAITDHIGLRTVRTEGKRLLLNGEDFFLKGVNMHGEYSDGKQTHVLTDRQQARRNLAWAREMGCNFIRGAHYPHPDALITEAQDMGILYWCEIPVYWSVDFDNPATYACAENQLRELITRDKNRANVIVWSVGNENKRTLPGRDAFLGRLMDKARELDPERLVSLAMERDNPGGHTETCTDPLHYKADLMSLNEYCCGRGNQAECARKQFVFDVDKPVVISEFGCAAPIWKHGSVHEAYTQERMSDLFRYKLEMYSRIDGLAGVAPWQLTETRTPRRFCSGIMDGYSRAGLVSSDGQYKESWYIMRDWYRAR